MIRRDITYFSKEIKIVTFFLKFVKKMLLKQSVHNSSFQHFFNDDDLILSDDEDDLFMIKLNDHDDIDSDNEE